MRSEVQTDRHPLAGPQKELKVIAAIPAYNEAKHIGRIVRETRRYVDLVIVVDDGSTDGTARIAQDAGAYVVKHIRNFGKGVAVNTAFDIARRIRPEAMILLDGDGQHEPEEIPSILNPVLKNKADMVVGSRFLANNRIPKYRMVGQTVLNITTNLGSGIRLTDSQSGFRAFSWRAIAAMSFKETGFGVESEMQFRAKECGLKVAEVPIRTNYDERVKRSPVAHGFGVLFRVLKMCWDKVIGMTKYQEKEFDYIGGRANEKV